MRRSAGGTQRWQERSNRKVLTLTMVRGATHFLCRAAHRRRPSHKVTILWLRLPPTHALQSGIPPLLHPTLAVQPRIRQLLLPTPACQQAGCPHLIGQKIYPLLRPQLHHTYLFLFPKAAGLVVRLKMPGTSRRHSACRKRYRQKREMRTRHVFLWIQNPASGRWSNGQERDLCHIYCVLISSIKMFWNKDHDIQGELK